MGFFWISVRRNVEFTKSGLWGDDAMSDYRIGRKPDWVKPPPFSIDFNMINEPLQGIYRTIADRLKKEIPDPHGFHFLLGSLLTTNLETHRAIVRLVKQDEKKKFPFQATVLIRTMVDSLFTILALKTDSTKRSRQFDLAGYRATWERHQREAQKYAANPEWRNHLEEQQKFLDFRASHLGLGASEKANPTCFPYWPIPSQMLRSRYRIPFSTDERAFLEHVDAWYYGRLSSYGHLHWAGMAFSVLASSPEDQWIPGVVESNVVIESLLFMLVLLSEVEASKKYGTNQDLRYVWVLLGAAFLDAKEYYEMRYSKILT